jgi:hypothetical protein
MGAKIIVTFVKIILPERMSSAIQFKEPKASLLEKFGIYYLNLFRHRNLTHHVFDFTDEDLKNKVKRISAKGILSSSVVGLVCVWPTVYFDLLNQNKPFWIYVLWIGAVNLVSIIIEFYLLFLIALRSVHEVSELINTHSHKKDFLKAGPFNITNILSRAAMQLPDPEIQILGINPFEKVSKRNLLILGLLYKCRILLTNLIAKFIMNAAIGVTIAGISIKYEALPVECFWNAMVILLVVKEARLRLFGFALSNHIADNVIHDRLLKQLSPEAKIGCLRAIGNTVVMAQNYHPNVIILLLRFQDLLHIKEEHQYDDWNLFLECLKKVNEKERNFLLDLLTVAASFDGKISRLESKNIGDAYGEHKEVYLNRLRLLTQHLKHGQLHAAADLCKIDFAFG